MTSTPKEHSTSRDLTAAGFDRPLLLTARQDILGYLSSRIGRGALFLIAASSVLAVMLIIVFVSWRSGLFLTTTGGDAQMAQRNTAVQKAVIAYETVLRETGDAQAAQAAEDLYRRQSLALQSPSAMVQRASDTLEDFADVEYDISLRAVPHEDRAEDAREYIRNLTDVELEEFREAPADKRLGLAQTMVERAASAVADQVLFSTGDHTAAAEAAHTLIAQRAEEIYRETLERTANRGAAERVRQAMQNRAAEQYQEVLTATGSEEQAREARDALRAQAEVRYENVLKSSASVAHAEQARRDFLTSINPSRADQASFAARRLKTNLTSAAWDPTHEEDPEYGFLALVYGSLLVTFGALIFAVPLGIITAVVLSDIVPFRIRQIVKPIIEILAAVPSVAFGFFAIKIIAPWMNQSLGFETGTNALNASVILAIMAVPTIVSVADDSLTALGRELREASYSLGATRFETVFKVIIPAAHNGIIAAVILGMMRAIGETMVVWMAAGNAGQVPGDWFNLMKLPEHLTLSVRTMTATIAGDMGEAPEGSILRSALFTVGLLLLLFTFMLNMISEYFAQRFRKSMGQQSLSPPRAGRLGGIMAGVGRGLWYLPARGLRLFGWMLSALRDALTRPFTRVIDPIRMPVRQWTDRTFTVVSIGCVLLLGGSLAMVLIPIFSKGAQAVLFRGTIEHRWFIVNEKNRGDRDAFETQREACWQARQPVYNTIERYAWLNPERLVSRVAEIDRETRQQIAEEVHTLQQRLESYSERAAEARRSGQEEQAEALLGRRGVVLRRLKELEERKPAVERASRRLARSLRRAYESTDSASVQSSLARVMDFEDKELLADLPAEELFTMAAFYRETIAGKDLALRDRYIRPAEATGLPDELELKYSEAYEALREKVLRLLGPEVRAGQEHMPPESRYGATHWSMAKQYREELLTARVWVPQFSPAGIPLASKPMDVPRRVLFEGTDAAGLIGAIDPVRENLDAMLAPEFTIYWRFFTDSSTVGHFLGGVGPEVFGTLLITLVAILAALPLGVIAAAYLVEVAGENVIVRTIRICINTLAGVPSIVFGLFGLAFFVLLIGKPCVLAAGLTLAVMILPVIIRATEEAIRSVPPTYKEASLGLGAGRFRCFISVTLPAALPGILTGTILGMSRAAGETAPILFTGAVASGGFAMAGAEIQNFFGRLGSALFHPTPALPYSAWDLAQNDYVAKFVPYNQFGMVSTLILLVLILNLTAILLRSRISRHLRGG